jgi:uncharacterized protein (TIGR01777 family)
VVRVCYIWFMPAANSPRVLVSGASGPIGSALLPSLSAAGYRVTRLVRGASHNDDQISWDPSQPLDAAKVSGFDGVVHLAGESIVGRWTEAKKARILESRQQGTKNLSEALARAPQRPRVFVSGSAIGFYGNRGDQILEESSNPGEGFLPQVCVAWEGATQAAQDAGIRTAHIRTGIVLTEEGGALPQMLTPFRLGVGGKIGDGRQWWSWIDIHDHIGAIHHILKTDLLSGAVNLVAPKPVTNAEFTKVLGSVLSRPTIFPMPAFAARLAFGQMGDELLLASQRVQPLKLVNSGYRFAYPELRGSLEDILST